MRTRVGICVNDCMWMGICVSEWLSVCGWVSGWVSEWVSETESQGVSGCTQKCAWYTCEGMWMGAHMWLTPCMRVRMLWCNPYQIKSNQSKSNRSVQHSVLSVPYKRREKIEDGITWSQFFTELRYYLFWKKLCQYNSKQYLVSRNWNVVEEEAYMCSKYMLSMRTILKRYYLWRLMRHFIHNISFVTFILSNFGISIIIVYLTWMSRQIVLHSEMWKLCEGS